MHRLLILLSLIPLLAAIALRKLNGDRILHRERHTALRTPADATARKMLESMSLEKIEVRTGKSKWLGAANTGKDHILLPPDKTSEQPATTPGTSAEAHGHAALHVGLHILADREPDLAARRAWALRFGHVFPVFSIIVIIFAIVVGKMPGLYALGAALGSFGIATIAQLLALACERRAATLAAVIIEKKRIFPRLSEEEAVIATTRALPWRTIVPGLLARLM